MLRRKSLLRKRLAWLLVLAMLLSVFGATGAQAATKVDGTHTYLPLFLPGEINVSAEKHWEGGDEKDHVAVELILERRLLNSNGEVVEDWKKVPNVTPTISPESGTANEFGYLWEGLPERVLADGVVAAMIIYNCEYRVREVSVPGYTTTMKVTDDRTWIFYNVYDENGDGHEVEAHKVWVDSDFDVTRPDVSFQLWRIARGMSKPEKVGEPKKVPKTTPAKVTFGPLENDGTNYEYFVTEVFDDPDDPANDNWQVTGGGNEDGSGPPNAPLEITNEFLGEVGNLTVKKEVTEDIKGDDTYEITVTGPYGYKKTIKLKAGEKETLDQLYYGRYTVTEKVPEGQAATYAPNKNGQVDLSREKPSPEVTVTNGLKKPDTDPDIPELIKDDHFVYMFGYPDKSFRPDGHITRAEVASMFARLMVEKMVDGKTYSSGFSDVKAGEWYANTVGYMAQKNIIKGYPDGTFRPNDPVTRAEFAAISSRFDKLTTGTSNFPDVPANHWAKKAIDLAFTKGWVKGYPDGTFRPENKQTRAETVSVVNKMLERSADQAFVNANSDKIVSFIDLKPGYWAYYEIMETANSHEFERVTPGQIAERWIKLRP